MEVRKGNGISKEFGGSLARRGRRVDERRLIPIQPPPSRACTAPSSFRSAPLYFAFSMTAASIQ